MRGGFTGPEAPLGAPARPAAGAPSITTEQGTTVTLHAGIFYLNHPEAAEHLQNTRMGRIVLGEGYFQPVTDRWVVSPAVLRAIADLLDQERTP